MHFEVPEFKRSMRTVGSLLITLSVITPASSVFIIGPGVVQQAGTGAFLSFLIGGVIALFTAFVYGELSSAFPLTGGEYTIVGRILGPLPGFVILGVNILTFILIFAAVSMGITPYLQPFLPGLSATTSGIGVTIITTLFGVLNIRTNAMITGSFLVLEMVALGVLAYLGFSHINRPLSDFLFQPVHMNSDGTLMPVSASIIGLATAVAVWAYNGYGNAVYLGEETHDAPKRVARVIILSLVITVIAEIVPITAVLLGAPDLKALLTSQNMFSDFISLIGGEHLNRLMSLGIALAILNANIATVIMVSRQMFSTGRDHVWPAKINYALTRIHGRFHSPWIATLVCGALACGACFIDMNFLFVIIGSSLVFIYGVLCVTVIAGRHKGLTAHGHYRMPFYPLPPVLALIAMLYILYADYLDEAVGRPSLLATLAMITISAIYYFAVLRRKGEWILRGSNQ